LSKIIPACILALAAGLAGCGDSTVSTTSDAPAPLTDEQKARIKQADREVDEAEKGDPTKFKPRGR